MKPEDLTVFVIPKNRSIENYNVINYMYPDNQKCLLLMIDDNYSELFELNKYSAKKMIIFKIQMFIYENTIIISLKYLLKHLDIQKKPVHFLSTIT